MSNNNLTKEIVIAAYDKPLDWMKILNNNVIQTIYRKGNIIDIQINEIYLSPNVGRCVGTFFYHILSNYDKLSDITYFAQDYPFDHWEDIIEIINDESISPPTLLIDGYMGYMNGYLYNMFDTPLSQHVGVGKSLRCLGNGLPHHPNLNVDAYWEILFDYPKPTHYEFIAGGHFGITKEQIRIRSKEFYKKINEILNDDPISPWIIERLECYIFNPNYKTIL